MVPASTESTAASLQSKTLYIDQLSGFEEVEKAKQEVRSVLRSNYNRLTLDLSGLSTVSSDLINFLLWCQMQCNRNFVDLKVRHVTPEMLRVFRFAGLNQVLAFEN